MFRRKLPLQIVGTDNKIEGLQTNTNTEHHRFAEQLPNKIGSLLLISIGITNNKFLNILLGVIVGLNFAIIMVSKFLHASDMAYVATNLSLIIVDLASWCLAFKTSKKISSITESLLKENRATRFSYYIPLYVVASVFLTPSLPYALGNLYSFFANRQLTIQYIIKSVYPEYDDRYLQVLVIADIVMFHMRYSAVYVIAFFYAMNCILVYEHTSAMSVSGDPREALKTCWKQVERVGTLEEAMNVPIFFVFAKISLQLLNTILFISDQQSTDAKVRFVITAMQSSGILLMVVLTADAVQSRCRRNVEAIFDSSLQKFESVGIRLSYLDYVKLEGRNRLTAWKVIDVDRGLLLTAVACVVTYGGIIAQVKH